MLGSLTTVEGAREDQAKLRATAPSVAVAHSDSIPSLRPGYWVVFVAPFPTGDAAIAYCRSIGRGDRDKCYASNFSNDPADRSKRIFPN